MENVSREGAGKLPVHKRILYACLTAVLMFAFLFVIGEFSVRLFNPQRCIYPRWKYSEQYGSVIYPNVKMIDQVRGKFKFIYTINAAGYRGKMTPVSNRYEKKNIVLLGDSYTFGMGVNDGEEYGSILNQRLGHDYNVINLALGGYGLTQQIRVFYEQGQLFKPNIVILQFCSNDPEDNFANKVTEIQNDRFVFKNTNNNAAWVKKYLSRSIIQKSELYNLLRHGIYRLLRKRTVSDAGIKNRTPGGANTNSITSQEEFYNNLLDLFAKDLSGQGIKLVMISVNGHLDLFPLIRQKVAELNDNGYLQYIDVTSWFENVSDFGSPEGHDWGQKAHAIVGSKLAEVIRQLDGAGKTVFADRRR